MKSYQFNKLTSVFHVCPVNDHEFRHNIVKLPVDPQPGLLWQCYVEIHCQYKDRSTLETTDVNLFFLR